jgi:hypothetical protein
MEAAIRSIQRIVETNEFVSFIKWVHIDTAIPVIPEGKYAVSVMVICYDRVYAECCKKKDWQDSGWDIHTSVVYGTTTNREGEKQRMYENSDLLFDFQEMYESSEGSEWGPVGDKVVYWAYLHEIPQGLKEKEEIK